MQILQNTIMSRSKKTPVTLLLIFTCLGVAYLFGYKTGVTLSKRKFKKQKL